MKFPFIKSILLISASLTLISANLAGISISDYGDVYYINYSPINRSKDIHKYSFSTKRSKVYISLTDGKECVPVETLLDPTRTKIAYSQMCRNASQSSAKGIDIYYYVLTIAHLKTKNMAITINNVGHAFSFSPKGDAIAFVEESPGERGYPVPDDYVGGAWICDLKDGSRRLMVKSAHDLNWSAHDGNIYISDGSSVYRYNPAKMILNNTVYYGIYFSTDGKYYSTEITEDAPSKIYRSQDNAEMVEWNTMILARSPRQYRSMAFRFWSNKLKAAVFSVAPSDTENVIFSVSKGRILGQFSGKVIGINAQGDIVAVHPPLASHAAWATDRIQVIDLKRYQK